jgi:hypothetical protein
VLIKTFTVENVGTKDIYLRAKFIAKWEDLKELDLWATLQVI